MHNLAEALSLMGHQVYAIDYTNRWTKNNAFDLGSLKTTELTNVSRATTGASICLKHPGFIKIPGLSRFSAAFTHYFEIQKTIKENKIDVIVLYSVATNGLQTVYLAKKFGIPVVFRAIDILHQLVPYCILRASTKFFEKKVYSKVDIILTITPKLSNYVITMSAEPSKVTLLPLPVDTELFHPSPSSTEIRHKWGLDSDDQLIVFIGTLHDFSGLIEVIRQLSTIIKECPKVKLLIVGDGPYRSAIESTISGLALQKQVAITGIQPYNTMPDYINLASICINPFLLTDATRDIFPSKIVQYLACGKVVVSTPLPGVKALISGEQQGIVYTDNGPPMAQEIVSLLKSTERRDRLGLAGLAHVLQVNSHKSIASKLESYLEQVINSKRSRHYQTK
jgi:glycosyltransferase involved in cell wall biosynthesis